MRNLKGNLHKLGKGNSISEIDCFYYSYMKDILELMPKFDLFLRLGAEFHTAFCQLQGKSRAKMLKKS